MTKKIAALILAFPAVPLFAGGRFFKMNMKNSSDSSVIKLAQVSETSQIVGNVRQTTVNLILTNSSARILEGEFEFPLNEHESVTGFALDINGTLRQGVAVEKEKGRQVFEDVVRKSVDPALLEMTSGNNFKARIYPIPANGFREIQVSYQELLPADSAEAKKETPFTQTIGKETYFYYVPDLKKLGIPSGKPLASPKTVSVYFDVSSSAQNRDIQKETELLERYLKTCGTPDISVTTFSSRIHEKKSFSDSAEAISFLRKQQLDGGTNMGLSLAKDTADRILIFSDGIHTFGAEAVLDSGSGAFRQNRAVAVCSGSSADFGALRRLCGDCINLSSVSVEQALDRMTHQSLRLLKAEFDPKSVSQLEPQPGTAADSQFCVAGILNRKSGTVTLEFGYDERTEKTVSFFVSAADGGSCVPAETAARLWAEKKIAALSESYSANKAQIISLAKKFTVVTPDTSLLVLETAGDYARYGITPPKELKAEYDKIIARQPGSKAQAQDGIPQAVYQKFKEYKSWWNKTSEDFKNIPKPEKYEASYNDITIFHGSADVRNAMQSDSAAEEMELAETAVVQRQMYSANARPLASAKLMADSSTLSGGHISQSAAVILQPWSSNAEYLSVLKKAPKEKMYETYLELKKDFKNSPAFYIEASDYFLEENLNDESLRILSNLAELNLENSDILRALGYKLSERGEYKLAAGVFEKLTKIRSEVPQFYRDLALAYSMAGEQQKAADSLWHIASRNWDSRYSEIQQTALNDLNAIIALSPNKIDTSAFDKKLLENFDVDIRIVLTWNTDDCDIDLWVTDPDGEKCFYGHKLTRAGGRMSRDFTQGYGPEEFALKSAPGGSYKIQANYFGNHQQKLLQPVTVQAEVYTNFGRPEQTRQVLTLQLNDVKQTFDIGEIVF